MTAGDRKPRRPFTGGARKLHHKIAVGERATPAAARHSADTAPGAVISATGGGFLALDPQARDRRSNRAGQQNQG